MCSVRSSCSNNCLRMARRRRKPSQNSNTKQKRVSRDNVQVGFVGFGAMGALIVPRLMVAGHGVVGWNRSRHKAAALIAAGMTWADTPNAVAEQCEIVFSIVTDGAAV